MSHGARAWLPVGAWAVVIAIATSLPTPIEIAPRSLFPTDKLAHIAMYAMLGWLSGRALWVSGSASVGTVLAVLIAGLLFAAVDEWHQELLSTRVASAADWLADVAGLILGLVVYVWPRLRADALAD